MQVPPIDAALLRITPETARVSPSLALAVGQQVTARVIASGGGRVQLDVAGQRLEARTALALVAGQALELQVASLGAAVTLRVLGGVPVVSEQQWALAALASAHGTPTPGAPDAAALLRALDTPPGAQVPAELRTRLAQLLGELAAGTDAHALAARLRDVLENSGVLFESRLRAWLQSLPGGAAAPGAPLPPALAADLKALLGVLARALGVTTAGGATATPLARGDIASLATPGDDPGSAALETLRGAVLNRQVETAYHWVRDGTFAMELPLAFDGVPVTAQLRFRRGTAADEAEDEGAGGPAAEGFFFDFALEPPGLGPIRAQAHLAGTRLAVRFVVARPDVAARIADQLVTLRDALTRGGLSRIQADVRVDAAQARPEPLSPPALPRGGSVVDALA